MVPLYLNYLLNLSFDRVRMESITGGKTVQINLENVVQLVHIEFQILCVEYTQNVWIANVAR